MFIVKKLSKNDVWNAISFIDQNGSFRGEAKFDSKKEALDYLLEYKRRMKNQQQDLKVFSEPSK